MKGSGQLEAAYRRQEIAAIGVDAVVTDDGSWPIAPVGEEHLRAEGAPRDHRRAYRDSSPHRETICPVVGLWLIVGSRKQKSCARDDLFDIDAPRSATNMFLLCDTTFLTPGIDLGAGGLRARSVSVSKGTWL